MCNTAHVQQSDVTHNVQKWLFESFIFPQAWSERDQWAVISFITFYLKYLSCLLEVWLRSILWKMSSFIFSLCHSKLSSSLRIVTLQFIREQLSSRGLTHLYVDSRSQVDSDAACVALYSKLYVCLLLFFKTLIMYLSSEGCRLCFILILFISRLCPWTSSALFVTISPSRHVSVGC